MPPRRLQTAKMAKMTSKAARRCLQDGQDGLKRAQDGPRRPKRPQRGLQEVLLEGPKKAKSLIVLRFLKDFWIFFFFGLPTAQDGPTGSQDRSKIAKEASKMAP